MCQNNVIYNRKKGGEIMAKKRVSFITGLVLVVKVGRGNAGGIVPDLPFDLNIEGSNLTATKAQILLMAALLKFGSLPPAADPRNPTPDEIKAIRAKVRQYQEVFDTH
jgi:hypothetical protein